MTDPKDLDGKTIGQRGRVMHVGHPTFPVGTVIGARHEGRVWVSWDEPTKYRCGWHDPAHLIALNTDAILASLPKGN